jgi:hypothetical protein
MAAAPQLNFLQVDALVPLAGAADLKEGFTRVPLTLCPPFSGQARPRRCAPAARAHAPADARADACACGVICA